MDTFHSAPTSRKVWNTNILQDDCQIHIGLKVDVPNLTIILIKQDMYLSDGM